MKVTSQRWSSTCLDPDGLSRKHLAMVRAMAALADHRLTVENVRQMFAVERELLKLLKEVPDLETRIGELRIWL